jgi:hypothetical protein
MNFGSIAGVVVPGRIRAGEAFTVSHADEWAAAGEDTPL